MILWLRRELIAADDEERTVGAVLGGEGEYLCSDQFSSMTSGATCVLAIDSAPGAGADREAGAAEGAIRRRLEEREWGRWLDICTRRSQDEVEVDVVRT